MLQYSSSPLLGIPLLPKYSVLIRDIPFVEREHCMHSQYLLPKKCVLFRGVPFLESVLKRGTTVLSWLAGIKRESESCFVLAFDL